MSRRGPIRTRLTEDTDNSNLTRVKESKTPLFCAAVVQLCLSLIEQSLPVTKVSHGEFHPNIKLPSVS